MQYFSRSDFVNKPSIKEKKLLLSQLVIAYVLKTLFSKLGSKSRFAAVPFERDCKLIERIFNTIHSIEFDKIF